jgi:hypothetical protein
MTWGLLLFNLLLLMHMDINNPFETFEKTAFRVEGLTAYKVDEEVEAIKVFNKQGSVPTSFGKDWAELVAKNIHAGKTMERLRLWSEPLSDYERFETQAYSGIVGGEDIRTVKRDDYDYKYDFWFFDNTYIARIIYENDGTFVRFDISQATDEEIIMAAQWHDVFEKAKPLRIVPFIPNTSDDLHCLPATYMNIAKYFDPSFAINMDEWSKITGFEEDKGTWANGGLVWFKNHGYEVKHIALFDYAAFINYPKEYLIELDGEEVGQWAYDHTNVPAEIERISQLMNLNVIERREPTLEDIKQLLDQGYLLRAGINCNKLEHKEGYEGHAITIIGYDDQFILFHDPGLPAIPNRKVTFAEFESAWADPGIQSKELDAIRKA